MGKVCMSCGGDIAMPMLEEAEEEKCENCDDGEDFDEEMDDGDEEMDDGEDDDM